MNFKVAFATNLASLAVFLSACGSAKLKVSTSGQGVVSSSVTSAIPVLAKSGDVVTLTGSGLDSRSSYKAVFSSSVSADVTVVDSTTATFVMPSGLGLGEKSFSVEMGDQTFGALSMISAADGAIKVYSDDASLVCSTDSFFNKNGEISQGTRNCDGGNVNPWDLRAGVTVGSTTGKLQVNCRNGATLATYDQGVPQTVSSIDTGTDVLTTGSAHGYSDNQTVRINYNGTAPGELSNSTTYYIRKLTADSFHLSTTSGGAAIDITSSGTDPIIVYAYELNSGTADIWDTIDDYNGWATAYPSAYSGWDSSNLCGGIEAAPDDNNVWKDVTTTGDGVTASTCSGNAENCSFKDKISGLEWHKADSTLLLNWSAAQAHCDNLSYNGHTDWRLPTQKEILAAYHNGIVTTAGATNWLSLSDMRDFYWSASLNTSYTHPHTIAVYLTNGYMLSASNKANMHHTICVRP